MKKLFSRKNKIVVIVACVVVVCGAIAAFWFSIPPKDGTIDLSYTGLTLKAAEKKAAKSNMTVRVVGGEKHDILTMDYSYHRVNVYTLSNIVIKASRY